MRFVESEQLAWLAGVLDYRRGSIGRQYQGYLQISLRLDSPSVPRDLKKEFGGTCFKNRGAWWFKIAGHGAEVLLSCVLPYLRLKKRLAEKLLKKPVKKGAVTLRNAGQKKLDFKASK